MQNRVVDFGAGVTAERIKSLAAGLEYSAVLHGFTFTVTDTDKFTASSGILIFPNGIMLFEDAVQEYAVIISPAAANYTLVYRHTDQDILGGAAATVSLEIGLLTDAGTTGTIIDWVVYPGGSVNLTASMLFEAPKAIGKKTLGDGIFAVRRHPVWDFFYIPLGFYRSTVDLTAAPTTSAIVAWNTGVLWETFATATTADVITITLQGGYAHEPNQPRKVSFRCNQTNSISATTQIDVYDTLDALIVSSGAIQGTGAIVDRAVEVPWGSGVYGGGGFRVVLTIVNLAGHACSIDPIKISYQELPYALI